MNRFASSCSELLAASTRAGKEAVMHYDELASTDAVKPIKHELGQADSTLMILGRLPFLSRLAGPLLTGNADDVVVAFKYGCLVCLKQGAASRRLEWMIVPHLL